MIATITLNPSLDYAAEVDKITVGGVNRTSSEKVSVGGKGINVSVMLGRFGVPNTAFGFLGGFTGDEILRCLRAENVSSDFVRVGGLSRINFKLHGKEETEFNGSGPVIGEKDVTDLIGKLRNLPEGSILVLAGSAPRSQCGNLYRRILSGVSDRGFYIAADTTGGNLRAALEYAPFLVKPNREEIEELFGKKAQTREEVFQLAEALRREGARNVIVSLGAKGALMATEKGERLFCPAVGGVSVDTIGSGDCLVAGFLAARYAGKSDADALMTGVAAGCANAFRYGLPAREEVGKVCRELAESGGILS